MKTATIYSNGSQECDTFYKMKQENATLFQKQTEKQNDDKLSDCLDNLFQEISTDLQIEQKESNDRTIDDEESIRTEQLKKQALNFLRD